MSKVCPAVIENGLKSLSGGSSRRNSRSVVKKEATTQERVSDRDGVVSIEEEEVTEKVAPSATEDRRLKKLPRQSLH